MTHQISSSFPNASTIVDINISDCQLLMSANFVNFKKALKMCDVVLEYIDFNCNPVNISNIPAILELPSIRTVIVNHALCQSRKMFSGFELRFELYFNIVSKKYDPSCYIKKFIQYNISNILSIVKKFIFYSHNLTIWFT